MGTSYISQSYRGSGVNFRARDRGGLNQEIIKRGNYSKLKFSLAKVLRESGWVALSALDGATDGTKLQAEGTGNDRL